jgi:anti-anti-sigma factor
MTLIADVTVEQLGELAVARVRGEIDASNRDWMAARLRAPLTNQSTALIVDLAETTYLDSAGIALMFELGAELRAHQQQLQLVVAAGSPIARMVSLTGLDSAVPTHAALDAALAQVGAAERYGATTDPSAAD